MQGTFSWSIPNSLSYTNELLTFSLSFLATARAYKGSKQITSRKHDQIYHCQLKKYLKQRYVVRNIKMIAKAMPGY